MAYTPGSSYRAPASYSLEAAASAMPRGSELERLVNDILKRRDPSGYYVIPAKRGALEVIPEDLAEKLVVEETSDLVILRTRSRSMARRLASILARRGLVVDPAEA